MDGVSMGKLVKAGYKIYRMREDGHDGTIYQIRERSTEKGEWGLYGSYPTKADRELAWKELAQDPMNMMDGSDDRTSASVPAVAVPGTGGMDAAEFERKMWEMEKEHEYRILRDVSASKVRGAAMRENMEKLLRVMFLRETKEKLKESGQWSQWCLDTGTDIKNADYEIGKLGDFRDDLLLKFSEFCGYDINKIRYLTNGNSEKLGVTIENGQLMIKGQVVPCTPEDVQYVVNSLQEEARRAEEKAAKEKETADKAAATTEKELKKAQKELKRIRREAEKQGVSPEEIAFVKQMEEVRDGFDALIQQIDDAGFDAGTAATPRMTATARTVIDYMVQRLESVWVRAKPAGEEA